MAKSQILMVISAFVCSVNVFLQVHSIVPNFYALPCAIVIGSTTVCLMISIILTVMWTLSHQSLGLRIVLWFTIPGLILALVQTVTVGLITGMELHAEDQYIQTEGIFLCIVFLLSNFQVCFMTLALTTTLAKIESKQYSLTSRQRLVIKFTACLMLLMAISSLTLVINDFLSDSDERTHLGKIMILLISNGFYFGFSGFTLVGLVLSESKESVWNVTSSGMLGTLFGILQTILSIWFLTTSIVSILMLIFSLIGTFASGFIGIYLIKIILKT
ncbi:hypothetical protein TCAL_13121 [Tigriopus californicus]|uniref:Uncharacterized protein n=1 Tax=Tigriopus californicus TaxID=6832 RepID=A0A553PJQ7_TIGCA|nr:uncharacterized protein LOC131890226 [Tigriopus californicus]TRY77917.1 hypothetical protein TCAL_13121 [Tigriopus californicus]|eukprot:TCALIF_13121-PA protein Name:"Protein of unknown function" AED:0.03 eAED:0.03 QI:119/1/0.75/1/0.66/0.5/4/0/272